MSTISHNSNSGPEPADQHSNKDKSPNYNKRGSDVRLDITPICFYYRDSIISIMVSDLPFDNPMLCIVIGDMNEKMVLRDLTTNMKFLNQNIASFNSHIRLPINKVIGYSHMINNDCNSNQKHLKHLEEIFDNVNNTQEGFDLIYDNKNVIKNMIKDLISTNINMKRQSWIMDNCVEHLIHCLQSFIDIATMDNTKFLPEIEEYDLLSEITDLMKLWENELGCRQVSHEIIVDRALRSENKEGQVIWKTDVHK